MPPSLGSLLQHWHLQIETYKEELLNGFYQIIMILEIVLHHHLIYLHYNNAKINTTSYSMR